MAEMGEYRFEIDNLTPTTLSLRRLQDYIPHLVEVFGHEDDIHLLRIDEGSAVPCLYAKSKVVHAVQRRLVAIKTGAASRKAYRAVDRINELLADDHSSAQLRSPYFGVVIEFPGHKLASDPVIGPISEPTDLQGELFQVGGRDETISLYLRSEGEIVIGTATREQGRAISKYLFQQVRMSGVGRWIRQETGKWKLVSFTMSSYRALAPDGIVKAIESIRAVGRELGIKPDLVQEED